MTQHADILDQPEPLRRAFIAAMGLHIAVVGGLSAYAFIGSHRDTFGAENAGGGAIGIQAVQTIPLAHTGMANPVANDSQSQVPQAPPKPERKVQEKESPNAIKLKGRERKRLTDIASERQRFRPFKEIDRNQVFAQQAPQVSNPLFSALPGSGRIGTGENTTLGNRFAGYAQQIQQLVGQRWHTSDVDSRVQTAPTVIATFDLLRDGSVRNLKILQRSGVSSLDYSVERAIMEASPFPPIPPGFDRDSAKIEFWFELKR